MNKTFQNIRRQAGSAVAAVALSAIFIGAAIGQPVMVPTSNAQVQQTA